MKTLILLALPCLPTAVQDDWRLATRKLLDQGSG